MCIDLICFSLYNLNLYIWQRNKQYIRQKLKKYPSSIRTINKNVTQMIEIEHLIKPMPES